MMIQTFKADSAAEAVAQIRHQLGPQAVVLHVRQVPAGGLARLWQKPRIEVVAAVDPPASPEVLSDLSRNLSELREAIINRPGPIQGPAPAANSAAPEPTAAADGWRAEEFLARQGLLPPWAAQAARQLQERHGPKAPAHWTAEAGLIREWLMQQWRPPTPPDWSRPQVLLGPAGSGKTTFLCKWLTQIALLSGKTARVWRLDGDTANTAEMLAIYGDILGVAVERTWPGPNAPAVRAALDCGEAVFIDLPGVPWQSATGLAGLQQRLAELGPCETRLVLNAAYETQWLLAQARAFAPLAGSRLVLTHVDEDPRAGKWWNLLLGTNYTVDFLSAGQNIPGDCAPATCERFVEGFFSEK